MAEDTGTASDGYISGVDASSPRQTTCSRHAGWEACSAFCQPEATFFAQTTVLAEVSSLKQYCDWMNGLFTPIPDGRYELKFFAVDAARSAVAAVAVFHGTQTGPGGPGQPTGKKIAADYVYHMEFEGDYIRHMTKVWNDAISLRQLGWG